MSATEELVQVADRIREVLECLNASEPELCAELDLLKARRSELAETAKTELRERGVGSWNIGGKSFKVAPGGTTKIYKTEEIQELAEERGDVGILEKYKVFVRTVDPAQISRLPTELRALYEGMCETVVKTPRVSFPKDLE